MASTTKTTNLKLSQFVGTDKPAWLTDYNGDMQKIDDGYKKLEDGNTATQADLDATKQDLSGSKTDIDGVKAEVQALEAQDIALGNRLTVVEGNYDTMHHEVAINQQDIADMKPYAKVGSNVDKTVLNMLEATGATVGTFDEFGMTFDANKDNEFRRIASWKGRNSGTNNMESIFSAQKFVDNNMINYYQIIMPETGMHFEYIDDNSVGIHFKVSENKIININIDTTGGLTMGKTVDGIYTKLFNIPVPVTP